MKTFVKGTQLFCGSFFGWGLGRACLRVRTTHRNSTTCSTTVTIMLAPTATPTITATATATATCGITIRVRMWVRICRVLCINNNTSVQLGSTLRLNAPRCAAYITGMPYWDILRS